MDSSVEEKPIIGYYDDSTTFSSSNTLAFSKGSLVGSPSDTIRETFVDYNTNDGSTTKIITDDGKEKTGEYYLNDEKVDKVKVNIYIQSGNDWVIEDDISKIDFKYEGSDIIFTFSFETKEEDTIEISYVLSIKEIDGDGTTRYFTADGYTISFTLNDKEVTIKLIKTSTGTSTSYTVDLTNGEGIRHQP